MTHAFVVDDGIAANDRFSTSLEKHFKMLRNHSVDESRHIRNLQSRTSLRRGALVDLEKALSKDAVIDKIMDKLLPRLTEYSDELFQTRWRELSESREADHAERMHEEQDTVLPPDGKPLPAPYYRQI